jgi:hypothetical protein
MLNKGQLDQKVKTVETQVVKLSMKILCLIHLKSPKEGGRERKKEEERKESFREI